MHNHQQSNLILMNIRIQQICIVFRSGRRHDVGITGSKIRGRKPQANAISTLVLGFAADPMARWVWPDPAEYLRMMPRFARAFGGPAFEHGSAISPKGRAPPPYGFRQTSSPTMRKWAQSWRARCGPNRRGSWRVMKSMAEHHPNQPHWYLPLIAADPNWIGEGSARC